MSRYPDLINELAIVQGETYRRLTHTEPGDLTDWAPRGQIRQALLADDTGDPVAVFNWDPPVYDPGTDSTTFFPYLTAPQTTNIPRTVYQGDPSRLRLGFVYVYDLEFESTGGEVRKLAPGFAQVIGEVTDNSIIWDPPIFWDGSIDHISLTATNGATRTYTIWGDSAETINLGQFTVTDGNGITDTSYDEQTGVLTITFDDGSTFQTGSLIGPPGEKGDPGDVAGSVTWDNVTNKPSGFPPSAHTHTESDITDLQNYALANHNHAGVYEPVDSTILRSADVGVTVQGFSANTVIDPNYVQTEENYTTLEKQKLGGIEPGAQVNVTPDWGDVTGKPSFATVATSGDYDDLSNKPTVPAAQVNSDWNATEGVAEILNKPTLFSGDYEDLSNKPTLGTAAATDSTAYATAAQGSLADTALQSQLATLVVAAGDETSAIQAATDVVRFRLPHAMTLTTVRASVNSPPVGSTLVLDISLNGTSILDTPLTIDADEVSSVGATVPVVLLPGLGVLPDDGLVAIDVVQVGATEPGTGLKVTLVGEVVAL